MRTKKLTVNAFNQSTVLINTDKAVTMDKV